MSNNKQSSYIIPLKVFAETIHKLLVSDRDVSIVFSGMTGEGKSTMLIQLFKEYQKIRGKKWDFKTMTWKRDDLMKWIDGEKQKDGTKTGQLPKYTPIALDELFLMFYRRNWSDSGQIDSIGVLNMARDRRLLIGGCVPNFWDLDPAFTSRARFYIFISERGKAWVFEQEINPYVKDKWNFALSQKIFRKDKHPYRLPNFVGEVYYDDLTEQEKEEYLQIRNTKRLTALDSSKKDKKELYTNIKNQRNDLIKLLFEYNKEVTKNKDIMKKCNIKKLTTKDLSNILGITPTAISMILLGKR